MTPATRKINTLIVDDDPGIVRYVTKALLPSLGEILELTSLTDSQEARRVLETRCFDILLSDIEMPDITGMEMLRVVKQQNPWTQVIFMTAHSTVAHLAAAIEGGASAYLLKPIERDELVNVVGQCASRIARWQHALRGTLRPAVVNALDA